MPPPENGFSHDCRREIGVAGCFRFFEGLGPGDRLAIGQCAAEPMLFSVAARRLAREVGIAPYFRGRTIAPFSSLPEASAVAFFEDKGLRPATLPADAPAAESLQRLIRL